MSSEPPEVESRPAASTQRWRHRLVLVLLVAVGAPAAISIMHAFPPTEYDFYPRCLFRWVTGWHCPGCGATRCLYALLHGDLEQALAYNPLFVIATPCLAYGGWRIVYETWTGKKALAGVRLPGWVAGVIVAMVIAFWIARNFFAVLAPHEL